MRKDLAAALGILQTAPEAYAFLYGSEEYPDINGMVYFFPLWKGTLIAVEAAGLPFMEEECSEKIFGFHIHQGEMCQGTKEEPFADTGEHYNPKDCPHPFHAGDLPPLFGADGYALSVFYTDRFAPAEVAGRTVVVHDMADDFRTQPSGDSGGKIACGEIKLTNPGN